MSLCTYYTTIMPLEGVANYVARELRTAQANGLRADAWLATAAGDAPWPASMVRRLEASEGRVKLIPRRPDWVTVQVRLGQDRCWLLVEQGTNPDGCADGWTSDGLKAGRWDGSLVTGSRGWHAKVMAEAEAGQPLEGA